MFDFLKKKIAGFVDKLTRKEETKEGVEVEEKVEEKIEEKVIEEKVEAEIEKPEKEITIPRPEEEKPPEEIKPKKEARPKAVPKPKEEKPEPVEKAKPPPEKKAEKPKPEEKPPEEKPKPEKKVEKPKPEKKVEKPKPVVKEEKPKPEEKPRPVPKAKEEEKPKKEIPKPKEEEIPKPKTTKPKPETAEPETVHPKPEAVHREPEIEIPKPETVHPKPETPPVSRVPGPIEVEASMDHRTKRRSIGPVSRKPKPETPEPETVHREPETPKPKTTAELPEYREEKKKPGISLSPLKAIKSFITREVEISESDVHELLEGLELELLEADVELGVAETIRAELEEKLVGAKVKKKEVNDFIKDIIRSTLVELMTSERAFDLIEYMEKSEKPVKLVFLGLNGTGKTTSIAKVAHLLMQNNYKVVLAAADTFRAAAIEQMEVHANRLDVKIIKRDYGADPTSVGYDAVSYAKAHDIDAVLIDTAGRQDTNVNLINELKKMDRVLQPDLKLYIGESIAGSSVIEQVSTFNEEIGIDGVILTKLDCDPKGGTILSITKATGIPVIYIGTGQKYEDLERFEAGKIIDRILT